MALRFYVYICFKKDGTPFYVGKGSGDRWQKTFRDKHNPFKARTAKKVGKPIVVKIAEFEDENEAFKCELDLILKLGRYPFGPLTNLTDGGGGCLGARHSDEYKKELSKRLKGKKLSAAHCLAISLGQKGIPKPPHTIETRQKMSKAAMGRKFSPETRQKLSETKLGARNPYFGKPSPMAGRKHSPETIARMSGENSHRFGTSRAALNYHHDEKTREKFRVIWVKRKSSETYQEFLDQFRGKSPSLETRAKISTTKKAQALTATPEHRAKISLAHRCSEETKEKLRATWVRKRAEKCARACSL